MSTVSLTPSQDTVVAEIFIAAPPPRVFEAITDPRQMQSWWGQRDMYHITDWQADLRIGGQWSCTGVGKDENPFRVEGEYLEIDPPRLLVHTWIASYQARLKTVVRWELEAQQVHGLQPHGPRKAGTGTVVKVRHEGFGENHQSALEHAKGWERVLSWLLAYAEEGKTVATR